MYDNGAVIVACKIVRQVSANKKIAVCGLVKLSLDLNSNISEVYEN